MRKMKIAKNLTYEQIGQLTDITAQQAHKIEHDAFNKIFSRFIKMNPTTTPVDMVKYLCDFFAMEPSQCIDKLNPSNKVILLKFIKEEYGKEIPELEELDENCGLEDIEVFFR